MDNKIDKILNNNFRYGNTPNAKRQLGELFESELSLIKQENEELKLMKKTLLEARDKSKDMILRLIASKGDLESEIESLKKEVREFAEWKEDNNWVKRIHTHPKNVGKYWSDIHCEYKTFDELHKMYQEQKK
jgi:ABC-type phosphate transport system auxiliary subunit